MPRICFELEECRGFSSVGIISLIYGHQRLFFSDFAVDFGDSQDAWEMRISFEFEECRVFEWFMAIDGCFERFRGIFGILWFILGILGIPGIKRLIWGILEMPERWESLSNLKNVEFWNDLWRLSADLSDFTVDFRDFEDSEDSRDAWEMRISFEFGECRVLSDLWPL